MFLSWRVFNFVKCFFCIYWDDHVVFVLYFINMLYTDLFSSVELTFHSWDESHSVVVYDPFDMLLDLVCYYFVQNFYIYIHKEYLSVVFLWCLCLFRYQSNTRCGTWSSPALIRAFLSLYNCLSQFLIIIYIDICPLLKTWPVPPNTSASETSLVILWISSPSTNYNLPVLQNPFSLNNSLHPLYPLNSSCPFIPHSL